MFCKKCGTELKEGVCPNCQKLENKKDISNDDFDFTKDMKSSKTVFLALGFVIIALVMILISTKFIFNANPVKITTTAIDKFNNALFEKQEDNIFDLISNHYFGTKNSDSLAKMLNDSQNIIVNNKINIKMPEDFKNNLGFSDVNLNIDLQKQNEKVLIDLKSDLDDQELLYLQGIYTKQKLFFKLLESSSNYYNIDISKYVSENEYTDVDVAKLITLFSETVEENIKSSDFKKSNAKITVDDKEIKVKKYSLQLNKDLMEKLAKAYINKLKDDEEVLKSLSTLINKSVNETKDILDDITKNIESNSNFEDIYYEIYVQNNNLKKITLGEKDNSIEVTIGDKVIYDFSKFIGNPLTITVEDEKVNFIAKNEDININVNIAGEDNKKVNISLEAGKSKIDLTGTYNIKEITKNQEYQTDLKIDLTISSEDSEFTIPITVNQTIKQDDDLELPNTENAIDLNNMSEAEQKVFNDELEQMPIYNIYKIFSSIFSNKKLVDNV